MLARSRGSVRYFVCGALAQVSSVTGGDAEKVDGVAKAAKFIKSGTYIGTALFLLEVLGRWLVL